MSDSLSIPWGGSLRIFNMGWFPMPARSPLRYRHPTFALHMHQYRGVLWINDKRLDLAPGDLTLTPPDTESHYDLERGGEHWCAHFDLAGAPREHLALPPHRREGTHSPALAQRLAWLAEMARLRSSEEAATARLAREAAESGVRELLLWLHFDHAKSAGPSREGLRADRALGELVELLERRYERDWSAKDLAAHSGLNADYLARQFRQRYGCTIAQFLLRRRGEAAQHLLRSTTLRIKEIGVAVGVGDPQKFNKDFRRIAGCSPSEFRSNWQR